MAQKARLTTGYTNSLTLISAGCRYGEKMFAKINFRDEFYRKLKILVLPITIQQFMLALVSATDAIMLGAVSQTALSAVSLAGQIQFVLNLFISGISAGTGIMAAQYWGKKDAASIEEVIPIALRANLIFSGMFTVLAAVAPQLLMKIFTSDAALIESGSDYLRAVSLSYLLCGISQIYLILLKNTGHADLSWGISEVMWWQPIPSQALQKVWFPV